MMTQSHQVFSCNTEEGCWDVRVRNSLFPHDLINTGNWHYYRTYMDVHYNEFCELDEAIDRNTPSGV